MSGQPGGRPVVSGQPAVSGQPSGRERRLTKKSWWTLSRQIAALSALVGLMLALLAAAGSIAALGSRSQTDYLLNRVGPLRTSAEQLLTAMINQETGIRGYAVNGQQQSLQPYQQGLADERRLTASIGALLAGHPSAQEALRNVRAAADDWRAGVADTVIAAVRAGDPSAAQAAINASAQNRFDRVRTAVAALQQEITKIRTVAVVQLRRTNATMVWLLLGAAVVVLLAGVVLAIGLHRLLARPVTDLAAQVRAISRGEYDRNITAGGPPEVAALGRDVDRMRRQIASDLTEVTRARQEIEAKNRLLEQQAEELTRSNRDLEQFAYVASHDLQEPLRKVASFCQLLQRRYAGQMDARADQYIAFAVDGAQRMQRLINDLLAFSRIGRVTSGFVDVDLNRVAGDAADQLDAVVADCGGEVTWDDLPTVRGEQPLLTMLVANLVNNSLKFRKPDVPPLVHLSGREVDGAWEISCADNGIGIEADFADKIFVIFQRLHGRDAYPGTGIGLAVAKKIVEYHGGRIWLDTEVADGTTIRFTLPMDAVTATDAAGKSERETVT